MSDGDKEALAVLLRGLGIGLSFVMLAGFAVGYPLGAEVAGLVLVGLAVTCFAASSVVTRSRR
jgi:hypothetical protein